MSLPSSKQPRFAAMLSAATLPAALLGSLWLTSAAYAPIVQEEGDQKKPRVELRTDVDRVVESMIAAQGGVEELTNLLGLSFEVRPFRFDADGLPIPLEPLSFSVSNDPERGRRLRLDQTSGEYDIVALFGPETRETYVDGQPMRDREVGDDALQAASLLNRFFDLNFGAQYDLIKLRIDGRRRRDGRDYLALRPTFPKVANVREGYRVYVNPETSRVERYDVFDPQTNRRTRTAIFSGLPTEPGFALPESVNFVDREGTKTLRWEFVDLEINPDYPEDHFMKP